MSTGARRADAYACNWSIGNNGCPKFQKEYTEYLNSMFSCFRCDEPEGILEEINGDIESAKPDFCFDNRKNIKSYSRTKTLSENHHFRSYMINQSYYFPEKYQAKQKRFPNCCLWKPKHLHSNYYYKGT